ncbi:MAG: response regulator [Lysobacterales bacterium]|jgi:two-component system phosphate regulon response regulator OmpR|nr:MAG: response regulator [Xanthomonadales bacterium]
MGSSGSVLIVDDDPGIRDMLAEYLGSQGFVTAQAGDGAAMRTEIERVAPDVVLLDLRLPREDGLSLARFLRERYDVGIIMVTGAGEVVDRIVGLEIGADDYVTKPFDPRELVARVKSVMRRSQSRPASRPPADHTPRRVRFGRCELDVGSHQLFDLCGREIPITSMEFDLLRTFAEHPGKALSRDRILTLTRNREWDPYDRSIDIRIARVRRKVEADPQNPQVIRTVRGVGYMYVPAVD